MSGMRTHMEVAGRMFDQYNKELKLMPGLFELLWPNAEAYAYGAAFPDWTHATDYATKISEVVSMVSPVFPLSIFTVAFPDLFGVLNSPPPRMTDEVEHWQPFIKRLSSFLRTKFGDGNGSRDAQQRIAFFLGIGCHEIQDVAFHFQGKSYPLPDLRWLTDHKPAPGDILPSFELPSALDDHISTYTNEVGEDSNHGSVEPLSDLICAAYPLYVRRPIGIIEDVKSVSFEDEVAAVYGLLGREPPVSQTDVANGRRFIDVVLESLSSEINVPSLDTRLSVAELFLEYGYPKFYKYEPKQKRNINFSAFDTELQQYFRGGIDNGAAVAFMNTMRWYAHFRGWYYFQNEFRTDWTDTLTMSNGTGEERGYTAYSGAVDVAIASPRAESSSRQDLQLTSGTADHPVAVLLRFEMADNADETRNIPRERRVSTVKLWLYCRFDSRIRADTNIEIYRVRTPWAWGRGPEPSKSTNVPPGVIGLGGASWENRNSALLPMDVYTPESVLTFRSLILKVASDLELDLQSLISTIAEEFQEDDTTNYDKARQFVIDRRSAWVDKRLPAIHNGLLTGKTLIPQPDTTPARPLVLIQLIEDLMERAGLAWSDAVTVLTNPERNNLMVSRLVSRTGPRCDDFKQWFENLGHLLAAWKDPRVKWGAPGCNKVPDDRVGQPDAVFTVSSSVGTGQWVGCDVTSLVHPWVEVPEENFGMLLKVAPAHASNGASISCVSSSQGRPYEDDQGVTIAHRPILIVQP